MYPSPQVVALLLALMLHRANKTRARISEKTLRSIANRGTLRTAFLAELSTRLEDLDVILVSISRGGYALIAISALEGAQTLLAKNIIPDEARNARRGMLDEDAIWRELGLKSDDEEDED